MTQLMPEHYREIEVMLDYEKGEIVHRGGTYSQAVDLTV